MPCVRRSCSAIDRSWPRSSRTPASRPIEITTHAGIARFPSIRVVLEADLRGWLPMVGLSQSEETIDRVLAAADQALGGQVSQVDGGIQFDLSVHIVSAEKTD
jgi:hypothetical protein